MDTLQKAIKELKKVKKQKNLGIINYMDEKSTLTFIAQQAQNLTSDGEKPKTTFTHIDKQIDHFMYESAVYTFGEPLVNAAIELYNS